MRWVFQCFEGIEVLHIRIGSTSQTRILRMQPLHHKILCLLVPAHQQFFFYLLETAECGPYQCSYWFLLALRKLEPQDIRMHTLD